jgi:hypothetical protein
MMSFIAISIPFHFVATGQNSVELGKDMSRASRHLGLIAEREGDLKLTNDNDIMQHSSTDLAASFLKAADEVELIADALATDVENWAAEYAAALRRRAYALSS